MKTFPQQYESSDFVFFLHIPKTAGTSVTKSLQAMFPEDRTLSPQQMNNVRHHPVEVFEKARLLCGHFTHDVYGRRLPRQPNFILTFLRDPIKHFVSTFFHLRVDPDFAYTTRLTADRDLSHAVHTAVQTMEIENFVHHEYADLFKNFQTRYLVRGLSSDYVGLTDDELLPVAKELLLQLPFFGLTESFAQSLELLATVMRQNKALDRFNSNAARNKPKSFSLDEKIKADIATAVSADLELYDFAKKEFAIRYQKKNSG